MLLPRVWSKLFIINVKPGEFCGMELIVEKLVSGGPVVTVPSKMVDNSCMWPLRNWNVASMSKEQIFNFV